jgi:hypothetical protein
MLAGVGMYLLPEYAPEDLYSIALDVTAKLLGSVTVTFGTALLSHYSDLKSCIAGEVLQESSDTNRQYKEIS